MEITQSPSVEGSPRMYIYTQEGNPLLKNRRNLFAMVWNEIPDIFLRRKKSKRQISICSVLNSSFVFAAAEYQGQVAL